MTNPAKILVSLTMLGILILGFWLGVELSKAPDPPAEVRAMSTLRRVGLQKLKKDLDDVYNNKVMNYEKIFVSMGASEDLAWDLAWVVVLESANAGINPDLTVGLIKVENPWLDRKIRSSAGAIGIMQVMPAHAGRWGCGKDLENLRTNICTGTRIMAAYLKRSWKPAVDAANREALLAFNGCVSTPGCEVYADKVIAKSGLKDPLLFRSH